MKAQFREAARDKGRRPYVFSKSAYVSIRQHTSAYISIRQHTSAYAARDKASLRQRFNIAVIALIAPYITPA
jgi:hypothetical protein